ARSRRRRGRALLRRPGARAPRSRPPRRAGRSTRPGHASPRRAGQRGWPRRSRRGRRPSPDPSTQATCATHAPRRRHAVALPACQWMEQGTCRAFQWADAADQMAGFRAGPENIAPLRASLVGGRAACPGRGARIVARMRQSLDSAAASLLHHHPCGPALSTGGTGMHRELAGVLLGGLLTATGCAATAMPPEQHRDAAVQAAAQRAQASPGAASDAQRAPATSGTAPGGLPPGLSVADLPKPAAPPAASAARAASAPEGDYLLAPRDQINVQVYGQEDLTRTVRVDPEGKV